MTKFKAFVIVAAVLLAGTITAFATISLTGGGGTFKYLVGTQAGVDWNDDGTQALTDETAATVTTKLYWVESCVSSISTNAATTPAHLVYCNVPDQTSSTNRGKIVLTADTVGGTASGATAVNWTAYGYGEN